MSILGYQIIKHCVFTLIFLSSSSFYLFEEEVGECTFSIGSNKWGHVRADHDQNSIFVFSPSFQFSGVCSCHKVAACQTGGEWWPCLCKSCSAKRGKLNFATSDSPTHDAFSSCGSSDLVVFTLVAFVSCIGIFGGKLNGQLDWWLTLSSSSVSSSSGF